LPAGRAAPPPDAFTAARAAGSVGTIGIEHTDKPAAVLPPKLFQGVYLTCWSAGSAKRIDRLIEMAREGRINSVVLDIKDASGYVAYEVAVPAVNGNDAKRVVIRDIASLVARLHRERLYVIARLVVFEDPRLALARPELAVHRLSKLASPETPLTSDTLWYDRKNLAWMDPNARETWDYNIAIAKDAFSRGFDEVNFDYIRFPSDGDLRDMYFPSWDGSTPRNEVIAAFFAHLRRQLEGRTISADLFGLSTVNSDDLGVGQVIEDAYRYFDYVCPMVYPSHYARGFLGEENPAKAPFKVVNYSMKSARDRLLAMNSDKRMTARLRPWLQDFNLGAVYDLEMVKAQIKALQEALGEHYVGFTMWNPSNRYNTEALGQSEQ